MGISWTFMFFTIDTNIDNPNEQFIEYSFYGKYGEVVTCTHQFSAI